MSIISNIVTPNLIIGGAPKCGTSSLFTWLNDHPEVCGTSPKETFFWMDKDNPMINPNQNAHQNDLASYNRFFLDSPSANSKIFCEATTHYLYQQTALESISKLEPKPHVIFLLRNPSNRIYSSFEYTKHNRAKFRKDLSFFDYVQILLQGNLDDLDTYIDEEQSLYVLKKELLYSTYIHFLNKWKAKLGQTHIHIFLFEELVNTPFLIMSRVVNILDIDNSFYDTYEFSKKNETYYIQRYGLHRALKKYVPSIPDGVAKQKLKKAYLKLVAGNKEKNNSDNHALTLLNEYFKPYNNQLANTFDLDIALWEK